MQRLATHLRIRSKTLPTLLLALGSLTTTDASVSGAASVQQAIADNEREESGSSLGYSAE